MRIKNRLHHRGRAGAALSVWTLALLTAWPVQAINFPPGTSRYSIAEYRRNPQLTQPVTAPVLGLGQTAGEPVRVNGNRLSQAINCQPGQRVDIAGNNLVVSVRGPCGEVNVAGNVHQISMEHADRLTVIGNEHRIRIQQVAHIDAKGNGHRVEWQHGPQGATPDIRIDGNANQVSPF